MEQSEKDIFISILKSARERIESAKETYVCFAIISVSDRKNKDFCDRLRAMIEKRIVGCQTVYEWLIDQGVSPKNGGGVLKKMRAYRLAWIDDMIRECQEEW